MPTCRLHLRHAGLYPIATKVLAEPGTRRLLAVQIVGGRGAGKRIDTAAAAPWGAISASGSPTVSVAVPSAAVAGTYAATITHPVS